MSKGRRILIVEDDRSIAAGLRMNLRHEGHTVELAYDGSEGLKAALETRPDLVLLDVMLPEINGYAVLKELRARGSRAGVIMLTAKGAEEDKVLGLSLGADDYIAKPFGLPELLARVSAVLRRKEEQLPVMVEFSDICVDKNARMVTRAGDDVPLSHKELNLLIHLIEHEGRALSRSALLDGAWGLDYEGTARTVDNFMASLRKKLEPDPDKPAHFLTVRGVGYRFQR